ncbi:MAG: DegV family protein [Actinomycetota bacterium]
MSNKKSSRIAIVTDSTSDIPNKLIKEYNIAVVPLTVNFEDESYIDDGISLTINEFYEKLSKSDKIPKSSQPSPGDFIKVYSNLFKTHDTIISIHISAKLSATINSAMLATKEFPKKDIHIVDSFAAHAPLGMIVLKAASLNKEGASKDKIIKAIDDIKKKVKAFILPKNLENLTKGGRIGKVQNLISSILDLKPILTLDPYGEIILSKITRGWEHAKSEVIQLMENMVDTNKKIQVIISNANAADDVSDMETRIREKFRDVELSKIKIGITVGTHVGTGIGLTFYQE